MADLSSCYFCARAVDAVVQEYTIVPPTVDPSPDERQTVVLCRPCRRKLNLLLEPVADAFEEQSKRPVSDRPGGGTGDSATTASADVVGTDPEPVFGTEGDAPDDEGTSDHTAEPESRSSEATIGSPGDEVTDRPSETAIGDEPAEGHPPEDDDSTPGGSTGGTAREAGASSPDEQSETGTNQLVTDAETEESDRSTGEDDSLEVPSDQSEEGVTIEAESDTDDQTDTEGGEPESADRSDQSATDPERGSGSAVADVSTSTYNRVVRLLQNREFPVVRDEFEELASNAYQMEHDECAAALDAAIEKDLLVEENGLLKRP